MTDPVAVLGTLASVLGVVIALVQSVRMRELRRRTNADVWLGIRTVRALMMSLERSQQIDRDPSVSRAYGRAIELLRSLLKQAVLDEKRFSEETIRRWRRSGRLGSDWQEAQARHFLDTAEVARGDTDASPDTEGEV